MSSEMKRLETTTSLPLASLSQQHGDYLQFRVDPSSMLARMKRLFGAKEWDKVSGKWIADPSREPIANDAFINDLMFTMEGFINTNNIMGNLKSEEAHDITRRLMADIIIMIGMRGKEYGIHPAKRSVLVRTIDSMIFITLTRAVNDGQRMHDDMSFKPKQTTEGRSVQYDDIQKK